MLIVLGCQKSQLHPVTNNQFKEFVDATGYITDAEQYDWSIVQRSIDEFDVLGGVNWKCPDGTYEALGSEPVLQVSYNDALEYCKWRDVRLPSYEEYWSLVVHDLRPINKATLSIMPLAQVNLVGNIWEITSPDMSGRIRLAGGSYLCDESTCNGTSKSRRLYVDKITGNSHIGFAVLK